MFHNRDLKPANIGFDKTGQVKIFDFGLARDCTDEGMARGKPRLMTGGAGTPRYMAPEVYRMDGSYGFPSDVYSFSILLWQLLANRVPYAGISSPTTFAEKVVKCHKRPNLKYIQSTRLKLLLDCSWSPDPKERPHFETICEELEYLIIEYEERSGGAHSKSARVGRKRLPRSVSDPTLCRLAPLGTMMAKQDADDETVGGGLSSSSNIAASSSSSSHKERFSVSRFLFRGIKNTTQSTPVVDAEPRGITSVAARSRVDFSHELSLEVKNERTPVRRSRYNNLAAKSA